ncbi:ABC transporter permease [Cryptosporangium japonicum]|uniref:Autoinducer 2 import system permease protein LsrD n=1 Tax=Cryptosporangium japonicum TaxID=80872 RepID=A0ABP3EKZ9_9ACTN
MTTNTLPETVDSSTHAVSTRRGVRLVGFFGKYGTLVVLGAMIVVYTALLGTDFFAVDNLRNVLVQSAIGVVIALGLTVVLMVGEFDLSVGYVASLAGVLTAALYSGSGANKVLMVLVVLGVGALVGLINGLVVTKLGVNALVGTLGVGSLVVGVNYIVTEGTPQSLDESGQGLLQLYLGSLGPVPWAVVLLAAVAAVLWLLLNRTTFGLEVQAVGGNRTAAELSGIRVHRVVIMAFVIGGTLAALGGLLITANVGSGQSGGGDGFLLTSFAAAFLGSAALRNGEFHVVGTLIGVLTVAIGTNGMAIYGVTASASYIFQGALLIGAVGMSTAARRMIAGRRVGH